MYTKGGTMLMKSIKDYYTLINGVNIPCLFYGTYKAAVRNNAEIIKMAIDSGYRAFDTASFYETEPYLAQAMKQSGLERKEFFITSKVWKTEMGYDNTKEAFARTLRNLQTEYLDLYLIHWPIPEVGYEKWQELDFKTWRAMEELYLDGKIKAIGLSNFLPHHIEPLLKKAKIMPMVNQLEIHPGYTQEAAVAYCQKHRIQVQAWSPIGRGRMFKDELITSLSEKYQVSPGQLCLRYELQKGIIPLPKSSSVERMKENQDIFTFIISEEDMYRIDTMPQIGWSGEHPDRKREVIS